MASSDPARWLTIDSFSIILLIWSNFYEYFFSPVTIWKYDNPVKLGLTVLVIGGQFGDRSKSVKNFETWSEEVVKIPLARSK